LEKQDGIAAVKSVVRSCTGFVIWWTII